MEIYINKIFNDDAIIKRIQTKLPQLFQMANIESSRAGKVGMEVGSPLYPPLSIINCINYGYVKGINVVGGIVGISYNNIPIISNCVNAGVVEGSSDVGSITGKE